LCRRYVMVVRGPELIGAHVGESEAGLYKLNPADP
jgi:hypothetical protein